MTLSRVPFCCEHPDLNAMLDPVNTPCDATAQFLAAWPGDPPTVKALCPQHLLDQLGEATATVRRVRDEPAAFGEPLTIALDRQMAQQALQQANAAADQDRSTYLQHRIQRDTDILAESMGLS